MREHMREMFRRGALPILCLGCGLLPAQEYRATLLGVVTDPSGAAVPGAAVTATNIETGVKTATQGQSDGNYLIPYLLPGTYRLLVEKPGFKAFERSPIELRISDRVRIDVALELGPTSERVNVTAQSPLLEVATASRGQVIENRSMVDLPVKVQNPYTLMNLAAGVQYTGSQVNFRPFDNGAINQFTIDGGVSQINEYQIDGVPNNAMNGNSVILAYVPPVEATQEFKVQSNTYDAQSGYTSGGIISLSIKPGTNSLHGAAYEYLTRTGLDANLFSNNAAGQPRDIEQVDQYGFELDGPVFLPHVYHGKNRTFFMFALERYRENTPSAVLGSLPTPAQRSGDFSQTFAATGKLYTIYDPLTVQPNPSFNPAKNVSLTNLQYVRTPFPGNQIPSARFNPIALNILKDFPLPNQPGAAFTNANNWYGVADKYYPFQNLISRIDHNISNAWRMSIRWDHDERGGGNKSVNAWYTPASAEQKTYRINDGAAIDMVGTLNPHTVLNARLGFTRYNQTYTYALFDQASLGFPRSLLNELQVTNKYPTITFANYLGTSNADGLLAVPTDTYAAQANLLKIAGPHSMKFGAEYRLIHNASINVNNGEGSYAFTQAWTSSNPQVTDAASGNSTASFLLGNMNSAQATWNTSPYYSWRLPAVFFQDDWQVSRRLTLNLGMRWDYESPIVERHNRQNRGFDFGVPSPIQVPGYDLTGGLLFTGINGAPRGAFAPDFDRWQPRFGLAYKVLKSKPLVFRGGFGRNFIPTTTDNGGSIGYSQVTTAQTSTPDYFPLATLSNPYPNGIIQPAGSSLGLATGAGSAISFSDPARRMPFVWQYSAGFEYELLRGTLLEASYVGSQTFHIQSSHNINAISLQQQSMGTAYLSQVVANPFFGVLPANTTIGAQSTTQLRNLLVPYPQFGAVTINDQSIGKSWYNSFQLRLEQRFRYGLSLLLSYTNSKTMSAISFLNPQNAKPSAGLDNFDTPQRLVISGIYVFPVGPGQHWFRKGALSRIVGGWQIGWNATIQSGTPISQPAGYYIEGNPQLASGQTLGHWFNTSPSIWVQQLPDTQRVTSLLSPNIRTYSAPQLDASVTRRFQINERHEFQFKLSAFNATNTPLFGAPNTTPTSTVFGVVPITQTNLARRVELGFRYAF